MIISDIRKKIKKNKIVFFNYKKLTDHDYRANFKDYRRHHNLKPEKKIKEEISLIRDYWQCDPMHYYRYRLFEKDLSYDELIDYIPPYYFYNHHLASIYCDLDISVTKSKISMNDYFINKNIETPVTVAIIKKGQLQTTVRDRLSYEELIKKFIGSNSDIFFMKPDKGRGGKGIYILKKINNELFINNELLDKKIFKIKTGNNDFIIQEGISQRSDLNTIYPFSVNTLRVITQYYKKEFKISAVVLRMGRNGTFVDNSAQGGISVNIDIEKGALGKYAFAEHSSDRFEEHPDTKFKFDGFILYNWGGIKQTILDYANKAREFSEIAWDIAIGTDKISVIEINSDYGIDHLQCCIGGMRRKLNINPDFP